MRQIFKFSVGFKKKMDGWMDGRLFLNNSSVSYTCCDYSLPMCKLFISWPDKILKETASNSVYINI